MRNPAIAQTAQYRALDMLHRGYAPRLGGRAPFWRPPSPDVAAQVWTPSWSWRRPVTSDDGAWLTVLDANGAYLSAAASVMVGHGALRHTGPIVFDPKRPGYWLIEAHPWPAWDQIMSPLGGTPRRRKAATVWVTTETVQLLAQLVETGIWPDVDIIDSWTADHGVRLRAWAAAVRRDREDARDLGCAVRDPDGECCAPHARESAIKEGYATAVVMFGLPERSAIHRPDWMHAIRAQSAASVWRYGWRCVQGGFALVGSGHVDELVLTRSAVVRLWQMARAGRPTPLRLDTTGRQLGCFKVKAGKVPAADWGSQ